MNKIINQKIIPTLWFDNNAEEAINFYVTVFPNSKVNFIKRWHKDVLLPDNLIKPDSVEIASFTLNWMQFYAFESGATHQFNPSISFFAVFKTVEEVETAWSKLSEGGKILMPMGIYDWSDRYGWIQDRYGVSWQIMKEEIKNVGQYISPQLMFSGKQRGNAEEAMEFYMSVFDDSVFNGAGRYSADDTGPMGMIKHGQCRLMGQTLMFMDNGHDNDIPFNEAISFLVNCCDQKEIDYYWDKFTKEGSESQCGWLKDQFGVSWQIVPEFLTLKAESNEQKRFQNMMEAMYQMKKLDMAQLMNAFNK